MIVAITGSPGVGKTAVAKSLAERGYSLLDLNALAREEDAVVEGEVDVDALSAALPVSRGGSPMIVESTWSHLLPVDVVVVLRCSPRELESRLATKGWPPEKVREILEGEAVDVIAVEVLELNIRSWEVDTTAKAVEDVARDVDRILKGETHGAPPGTVDWSEEVLDWY